MSKSTEERVRAYIDEIGIQWGYTSLDATKNIMQLFDQELKVAKLKAAREVRGDYLFMMNTHDFGRPFSYEKVLQVTKDAYQELDDELTAINKHSKEGEKDSE